MGRNSFYTPEMVNFIRNHAAGQSARVTMEQFNSTFPERPLSYDALKSAIYRLGLRTGTPKGMPTGCSTVKWPADAQAWLMEHYKDGNVAAAQAGLLKVTGKTYTVSQIKAWAYRHGLRCAFDGRFGHGQKQGRKIKPGQHISPATEFRKGKRPHNASPVGTQVVNADGYLVRKMAEPDEWAFVHHLVWQAEHGPIPKGCNVIFLDGNPLNISLDNLELATKGEHAIMNREYLRTTDPDLTKAGLLIAKVKIARKKGGSK